LCEVADSDYVIVSTSGGETQMRENEKVDRPYLKSRSAHDSHQKVQLMRLNAADRRSRREPMEKQQSLTASFPSKC
jgi:hypothetical protein